MKSFFKDIDYGEKPKLPYVRTRLSTGFLFLMYEDIFKIIQKNHNITNTDLAVMLKKSRAQTTRYIKSMVNDGILESTIKYECYYQSGHKKIFATRTLKKKCNIKK